jgi:DNA-binding NarL/FixJ family response regulator
MSQTDSNTERITVFVVDDHDVVRKGLRYFLSAHPQIAIVGEAGDAQTAVQGVAEHVPDVVLMDLVLPLQPGTEPVDQGGVQATRLIRQISPHTQVVVLTSFAQDELIFSAIKAGALSYLLKDADGETVLDAIHAASRGEASLHPRIAQRLMDEVTTPGSRSGCRTDGARDGSAPAGRSGPQQRRDRHRVGHHRAHGQGARQQPAGEAAPLRPHPGGGLRLARGVNEIGRRRY